MTRTTFQDDVCFLREVHDLGPMKVVPRKALESSWSKASRQSTPPVLSYAMRLSGLAMTLRMQTNAFLQGMGEKCISSFITPLYCDYRYYHPDGIWFVVPFEVHPSLASLLSLQWSEMSVCYDTFSSPCLLGGICGDSV